MIKRNMRLIVSNQFFTTLADSMFDIAILWYVYQLTNSAFFAATVMAITTLTNVLVAPVIGVFLDRKEPKTSMQIGYAFMFLIGIMLASGYFIQLDSLIFLIYVSIILQHVCMIFVGPAENKLLPRIVGENRIVKVNGYITSTSQTSKLIGQSISGFVIGLIGFIGVMLTHSFFYLLASILLIFVINISLEQSVEEKKTRPSFLKELKSGLHVLKNNKPVFKMVLLATALNVTTIAGSLLVVLVTNQYGATAIQFGLLNASGAVIGIIMGLLASKIINLTRPFIIMTIDFIIAGLAFIGMGMTDNYYIGLLFFILMIGSGTIEGIMYSSILIILVQDEFRGRVATITVALASFLIPPLTMLGGYMADVYQVSYLFLFAGAWMALWALVPILDRDIRSINKLQGEG
ncbi:MFS transporter [Tenuibacillus multivorans]|uniref:Na+/melibiose symporter n=1 Tax=Tenuibacillus multivorans TaxID=237069 RepID=A0A1H0APL9_9BACI|nr:MFS transporter [Tenuibacillus multivorans]GEL78226.1 MFS transporter [Tenuibacillus multivorans]SDN35309.1 Na+/melibiose symporter [Tenuibacillus multivorans]